MVLKRKHADPEFMKKSLVLLETLNKEAQERLRQTQQVIASKTEIEDIFGDVGADAVSEEEGEQSGEIEQQYT